VAGGECGTRDARCTLVGSIMESESPFETERIGCVIRFLNKFSLSRIPEFPSSFSLRIFHRFRVGSMNARQCAECIATKAQVVSQMYCM
jgi:hypothetical protein